MFRKLADVARPGVALHQGHGLGREALDVGAVLRAEALEEGHGQQGDVALALAQGRQVDRHHVEPIIEVLAERPFGDHLGQVAVGGGDQADVDVVLGGVADLLHAFALQHAEQLALGLHAEVGDFVEEQRALVGGLEQALLGGDGPGERAFHVAEQLAFQEAWGPGRCNRRPAADGPCGG